MHAALYQFILLPWLFMVCQKLSPHFAVLSSHRICFVPVSKPHNRASSYETRKLEIFRNGKVPRLQPCADLARLNRPSRSVTARTCVEADRSSLTPFLVAGQWVNVESAAFPVLRIVPLTESPPYTNPALALARFSRFSVIQDTRKAKGWEMHSNPSLNVNPCHQLS